MASWLEITSIIATQVLFHPFPQFKFLPSIIIVGVYAAQAQCLVLFSIDDFFRKSMCS
jgi:hypothetical protein